jgi:hypothetical protein
MFGVTVVAVGCACAAAALIVNVAAFEVRLPGFCTVTKAVPEAATRFAGTKAVNWVALTKTVDREVGEPLPLFHCTTEPLPKLVPVTPSVNVPPAAATDDGLRPPAPIVGGVGAGADSTVKTAGLEPCEPVCTVTNTGPTVAIRFDGTTAVNCVELTYTVGSDCDPSPEVHCTTDSLTKLAPLTFS